MTFLKLGTVLFVAMFVSSPLQGQSTDVAAAPVPGQLLTAKKVFVSNAGMDARAVEAFQKLGDPNHPYNLFYASMKSWGRYELVGSPAEADLVAEIRFNIPIADCDKIVAFAPQFEVVILDSRTHFVLWTLTGPIQGAWRKGTLNKNINSAMTHMMADFRNLVSGNAGAGAGPK
jgi:hypothetical protein